MFRSQNWKEKPSLSRSRKERSELMSLRVSLREVKFEVKSEVKIKEENKGYRSIAKS